MPGVAVSPQSETATGRPVTPIDTEALPAPQQTSPTGGPRRAAWPGRGSRGARRRRPRTSCGSTSISTSTSPTIAWSTSPLRRPARRVLATTGPRLLVVDGIAVARRRRRLSPRGGHHRVAGRRRDGRPSRLDEVLAAALDRRHRRLRRRPHRVRRRRRPGPRRGRCRRRPGAGAAAHRHRGNGQLPDGGGDRRGERPGIGRRRHRLGRCRRRHRPARRGSRRPGGDGRAVDRPAPRPGDPPDRHHARHHRP